MKPRRGNKPINKGGKTKENFVANFLFWMTLIGLSTAAFAALLAVTTVAVQFATTRVVSVWRPMPVRPATTGGPPPRRFTTFQMQGYMFDNPADWRAQAKPTAVQLLAGNGFDRSGLLAVPDNQVTFSLPNGTAVAEMRCPIRETGLGYPENEIIETRQFVRNGVTYTAILRSANGQRTLILMLPASGLGGYDASCQIRSTAWGAANQENLRRVYQSLR